MHRLLERADRSFTILVPLTYLVGLFLGTAAYFSGVVLQADLAVGIALAFSVEVHSFLAQRRVRTLWQHLARTPEDTPERAGLLSQLRVHLGILAFLVALSIYNSVAFVATVWPATPGFLPAWLQIGIRGSVIPLLFLATGALSPLQSDASALLAQAADDMLYATVRSQTRQWKARIKRARRDQVDLTPLTIALMLDAGDADGARRIQLIADGLRGAEQGAGLGALFPVMHEPPSQPPTGGGTPLELRSGETERDLPEVPAYGRPSRSRRIVHYPAQVPAAVVPAGPVAGLHSDEEVRARAILDRYPDLSVDELAQRARVAKSTASKVRRVVHSERAGQRAQ